jgi:uncharacterized protein
VANQLINEKSPYLLQHAHNPVDWMAWGEEAFSKAYAEDKPIFLSIGYSTCHWCHVMEHESFESAEIAEILNAHFVSIKVDREERPDVDRVYMTYVQAATGSGGWPMSVWLTSDLKPFYGGTYFPPDSRYGRPGFGDLLKFLNKAWKEDRDAILRSGANAIKQLAGYAETSSKVAEIDVDSFHRLFKIDEHSYDSRYGGFGQAPKFPRPATLNFLFRYGQVFQEPEAARMALHTLKAMSQGGMFDQLGAGFHRYSVDEKWLVPHFEKMLYDQAQLVLSLVEAYLISGDEYFKSIASQTLQYVLRDLTSDSGGFYSAEDADSVIDPAHPQHKGEGAFYIWSWDELKSVLGDDEATLISTFYGCEPDGNVDNDPHQEFVGKNILFEAMPLARISERLSIPAVDLQSRLEAIKQRLLWARATRIRPHLDDKVLTSWNGLMIQALSKAAQAFQQPEFAQAAKRAADFVDRVLWSKRTGTLLRRYRDGEAAIHGFVDDYAAYATGLIDLYETLFDPKYLVDAQSLCDTMLDRFWDSENHGFFSSEAGDRRLILRLKDDYDGAEPSGNTQAVTLLLRLGHLLQRPDYLRKAEQTFQAFSGKLSSSQSVTLPQMVASRFWLTQPVRQVIIAGALEHPNTQKMLQIARSAFSPFDIILVLDPSTRTLLDTRIAALEDMQPDGELPRAFVCQNFVCQLPTADLQQFTKSLN